MNVKPTYQTVLPLTLLFFFYSCSDSPKENSLSSASPASQNSAWNAHNDSLAAPEPKSDPIAHLRKKPDKFIIKSNCDTTIKLDRKGTKLHIPKNAFVFEDGKEVTSPVEISFCNYTNSAEIAFSQLPMTYMENGEELLFNSAGMFEINGTSEGRNVLVAENNPLKIDYALVNKPADLSFYSLDPSKSTWTKIQKLETKKIPEKKEQETAAEVKQDFTLKRIGTTDFEGIHAYTAYSLYSPITFYWRDNGNVNRTLEEMFIKNFKVPDEMKTYLKDNRKKYLSIQFQIDQKTKKLTQIKAHPLNPIKKFNIQLEDFLKSLPPVQIPASSEKYEREEVDQYELQIRYITPEKTNERNINAANAPQFTTNFGNSYNADPGHTYPDVVKGLTVNNFGIYNCDAAYRIENRVNVIANYIDEKNKKIETASVLSMIDLQFNGAYSFSPNSFYCNSKTENALVLITSDSKIYFVSPAQFKKDLTSAIENTFHATEVTEVVKTSDDLAKLLQL